jgi:hypothetical protein
MDQLRRDLLCFAVAFLENPGQLGEYLRGPSHLMLLRQGKSTGSPRASLEFGPLAQGCGRDCFPTRKRQRIGMTIEGAQSCTK